MAAFTACLRKVDWGYYPALTRSAVTHTDTRASKVACGPVIEASFDKVGWFRGILSDRIIPHDARTWMKWYSLLWSVGHRTAFGPARVESVRRTQFNRQE